MNDVTEVISPRFANLKLWQYQALQMKFDSPHIKQTEIAKIVDRHDSRVSEFFSSDKYKNAVMEYGKERLFNLIPKALKTVEIVMDADNAHAKLNAAIKILEDSGVLSKETITRMFKQINTQINIASFDLEKKTAQELGTMLLEQIKGFKTDTRT